LIVVIRRAGLSYLGPLANVVGRVDLIDAPLESIAFSELEGSVTVPAGVSHVYCGPDRLRSHGNRDRRQRRIRRRRPFRAVAADFLRRGRRWPQRRPLL
jgi:hypothetical protein